MDDGSGGLRRRTSTVTSAALVAKYGASFPNCILSKEKNCLEAGCGGERRVDGEIDDSPIKARFVLPCGAKVLASLPYFGYYGMRYMRSSALKFFYSDTMLVPLWWIAFTVVVAVAIDALTDPISSTITDQCRSTFGRRRPFIAIGGIVSSILFALLWMPCVFGLCPGDYSNIQCVDGNFGHVDSSWIYFFVMYLLFFISLDILFVPLEALSAELSPTYSDRNCLFGVQQVFTVIGIALGVLTPAVLDDGSILYTAAIGFAVLMILFCWILVCCVKERGQHSWEHQKADIAPVERARIEPEDTTMAETESTQSEQELKEVVDAPGASMEQTAELVQKEQEKVDAAMALRAEETAALDALGIDVEDLETVDLDHLEENSGLVPGFIGSLRNACFRILLLSEICEALGDELQYTVLAYVPIYVIRPIDLTPSFVYLILAGTVLVFQLITIPFWMFIGQRFGKYKGYLAYNFTLGVTTMLKIFVGPEEEMGLTISIFIAVLWGIGLGGAFHLYRSMLADVIDYDELLSGQRREGQFGVFGDFIPKMVEVPSTVVPLIVMAAYGYQPNVELQNEEVVWTLRLCFSIVPGFFIFLGAVALLCYPKPAQKGSKCLDAIQNGIVLHAAGKEAYDPVRKCMVAAPQHIRASVGGTKGVGDMEHFFKYEIKHAVDKKSKTVLVYHTVWQLLIFVLLSIGMVVASVYDWQGSIAPTLQAGVDICSNYTTRENCAGFNNSCTECAFGFYGPNCSACPGLLDREDDDTNDFVGIPCNGQGVCDPVNGTCTCTLGSGFYGPWCGVDEDEPATLLPIYIAILGLGVFFIAFHGTRLRKAIMVANDESMTLKMIAEYHRLAFGRPLTKEEEALYGDTQTDENAPPESTETA